MNANDRLYEILREITVSNPNLADELTVDKYNLDVEAEKQSRLMLEWSVALAVASKERDKLKEQSAAKKAELIGRGHAGENTGKNTDAGLKAWVESHPEYTILSNQLVEAEEHVNLLFAAKNAIDHKKSMIETIAKLWLGGYYARPHVKQEAVVAAEKSQRSEQLESMQERAVERKRQRLVLKKTQPQS